ncbi:DivIVA domain-containing protein [Conyzicola nivalis]|uniref:Cell wall synthesis protein Wag31 n=1 Tax=Conyzicola nivalis TaxID=1477021 RepID=A0ABV2QLE6_9MICO
MLKSTDITTASFAITKFREGYEQAEVDALLDSATAALAAWESQGVATLSSEDVNAHKFQTTKFGNGYDQDQVDDLLDQLVAALAEHESAVPEAAEVAVAAEVPEVPAVRAAPEVPAVRAPAAPAAAPALLRASTLPDKSFTTTRFKEGYSVAGVDDFLAAVRAVIADHERGTEGSPALSGDDVVNVRFTPTKFKRGYNQGEVDDYLDQIVVTLRHYEQAAAAR